MPDTIEQPPVAEKSFLDSAEFGNSMQEALDAAAVQRGEKPAAIAPVPEKPKPTDPKPEPKPGEPTKPVVVEDDTPSDIRSEAGKSSWKKLKDSKAAVEKERDDFKTKYETVNSRIAELEQAAKTPAQQAKLEDSKEYQQLKTLAESRQKEVDEYSERLRLLDVEQHPKFKAYFEGKVNAQMAMAKNVAGDKALEILKLPQGEYRNEKLEELAAELTPMKAAQLATVLTRLDEIEGERQGEVASAKANYGAIQAEQKQKAEQNRAATENLFKQVTADVTDKEKGLAVFQEREGDDEWNKGVRERLALAKRAFSGEFTPEEAARAVYWAASAPVLLTEHNGLLAKYAALEKEISTLRAASPSPGGTRPGDSDPAPPITKTGTDGLMEALMPSFQQQR